MICPRCEIVANTSAVSWTDGAVDTINNMRVFATYQIPLGWKTYEYYYETRRTPQSKAHPTQEKKKG